MKKQKSVTARQIMFALILAGFIATPIARLRAQSSESISSDEALSVETLSQEDMREAFAQVKKTQGQRIEGSWMVTVTPVVPPGVPQPPPFRVYQTFSRGGAFIGSDRNSPFGSPQHGTWAHTDGDKFAFTFIQDLFNLGGIFQGTLKIRAKLTLIGGDELVGEASGEIRDAAGKLTLLLPRGPFRGQRIKIEPLAP